MLIRSSVPVVDEALCAMQGALGAVAIHAMRGAAVCSPVNAAICFAGVALLEKLAFHLGVKHVVPGSSETLGPIPIGLKKIVSTGLAVSGTLQAMKIAGLIASVPQAVVILGGTCAAVFAIALIVFLLACVFCLSTFRGWSAQHGHQANQGPMANID